MLSFFKKSKPAEIIAPISGKTVDITTVPDQVFADKLIGDGVAIEPTAGLVVAPCDGKIVQIFPTNHAVGIETENGYDLLIHVGINTVDLKGEGFTRLVEENTKVKKGDPLLQVDLKAIQAAGKQTTTLCIVSTMDEVKELTPVYGDVIAGQTCIMKVKAK